MIDKLNIPIRNKLSNSIEYTLYLDEDYWCKYELDPRGNELYFKNSNGYWVKRDFDSLGGQTYYENEFGTIRDDRKI